MPAIGEGTKFDFKTVMLLAALAGDVAVSQFRINALSEQMLEERHDHDAQKELMTEVRIQFADMKATLKDISDRVHGRPP